MKNTFVLRVAMAAQKHAPVVFVATAIITVVLGFFALRIRIAPDVNAILPKQSKAMQFASDTGQNFASEYLVIAVQSPELYTVEKLTAFADAVTEIEKLPGVRGSTSPFNFVTFRAEGRRVLPTQLGPGGHAPSSPPIPWHETSCCRGTGAPSRACSPWT
jgi:predicted RND superfamily exporter protein